MKDQKIEEEAKAIRNALVEGMNSGVSNATIDSIWEAAMNEIENEKG